MPKIEITGEVPEGLDAFTTYQLYNNFDSAITAQLVPAVREQLLLLSNTAAHIYAHEMDLQKLCLEMGSQGFPIDIMAQAELLHKLRRNEERAMHILDRCTDAIGFGPLNPRSSLQVQNFFYKHLRLPEQKTYDKATRQQKVTTDIKALEKLRENYPIARIFVNAILAAREASKMASVFRRGLESNYKLRCNFSPAGTDTGRMSSQKNPFGRGTNAQNLTDEVRKVICDTDPNYYILQFDLKTAESIAVGYLSGDEAYIEACLSGDLHTAVARMNWPDLPWTGDLKADKAIAEKPYYRMFSYRDMAKRGGHATNYYGTARTVGMHLKLPTKVIQDFQDKYFEVFPGIPRWQLGIIAEIQTVGKITTPFGRTRRFWGRSGDATTHRAAIAYGPQSLVADVMNTGLLKAQRWIIANGLQSRIQLLAQVHDAGIFRCHRSIIHRVAKEITRELEVPIDFGKLGAMVIPSDLTVGKRWCKPKNSPEGQVSYSPALQF